VNDRSLEIYCIASSGSFWPVGAGCDRVLSPPMRKSAWAESGQSRRDKRTTKSPRL